MKLFNLFKKESSRNSDSKNVTIQKLEKNQLEKVIGGGDGDAPIDETSTTTGDFKNKGAVKGNVVLNTGY